MGDADDAVVGGIIELVMGEADDAVVGGNTGVDILDVGGTAAGGVLDCCAAVVTGGLTTAAGDVVDTTGVSPTWALVIVPL